MTGITVVGSDSAGGTQRGGGQSLMRVDGQLVVVLGDAVAGHGDSPHDGPSMVTATPWFRINGIPVCRAGDRASCGHTTSGRSWFNIN